MSDLIAIGLVVVLAALVVGLILWASWNHEKSRLSRPAAGPAADDGSGAAVAFMALGMASMGSSDGGASCDAGSSDGGGGGGGGDC
jgi:hypothetical protein